VQKFPGKGQFILTGSVRFSARKSIRESLTGRIQILELHPLTLAEAEGRQPTDIIQDSEMSFEVFQKQILKRMNRTSLTQAYKYLDTGGLPGICFLRDEQARRPRFSSHLDTILGRDLQMVSQSNLPIMRLRDLLAALAQRQGEPLAMTELARTTRISVPALRKLLDAFEALYLIRRVLPMGDIKKEAFFLEDQGTASYLAKPQLEVQRMTRLAFSQLYPHLDYRDPGGVMTYRFETRNGACIPLVFKTRGITLGVLPLPLEVPLASDMASVKSLLRHEPKARVLILTRGTQCISYSDTVRTAPLVAVI
jgi:predicted AAA+ superfamily ATPase